MGNLRNNNQEAEPNNYKEKGKMWELDQLDHVA